MNSPKQFRTNIDATLEHGEWFKAHAALGDLWRLDPKATTAAYVVSCYDRLRGRIPMAPCKISFLRSMTVEPLVPMLRSTASVAGIDLTVQVGQFNAYVQEILDPASSVYSFEPNVVILAMQTRDILPEIWEAYSDLTQAEVTAAIDKTVKEISGWVRTFRLRSKASLIIHSFEKPTASAGILESQINYGQMAAVDRLNNELRDICGQHRGVYVLDYDGVIARHGRTRWYDETKWLTMRMPFSIDSMLPMVSEWMKFIHPLTGNTCKVLALDLDNTLWGGVLSEDGPQNLQIGTDYPGSFHRALQRAALDLYHRGILLAVCSKNNHDEAMSALQNLPGMLLRPEHFAAFKINWQDKAQNLREIAAELNVGVDAIAFLDDNPVERDQVRAGVPEAKVIALPDNVSGFASALRECPLFERLSLTNEDRELTNLYRGQQAREQLAESAGSLEDFYRSLNQEISISPVGSDTIARVAQLTQKTNQFNVTTRRYSEQEIEEIAAKAGWNIYSIRVKDRFGDNGIVGVVITKLQDDICEIDTFLLSCRVIGRTIETAMLGYLTDVGKSEGARFLQGWFLPTTKNTPVRDLYSSHKFQAVANQGAATLWRLNLAETEIAQPEWIRMGPENDNWRAEQARA